MYGTQEIPLTHLGTLISKCWSEAEQLTASAISERYFGPNEETITFLFASELRALVSRHSKDGKVSRAFLSDVKEELPQLSYADETALGGLIARVNFHNRRHEGKMSASDLGIVIRRPNVTLDTWKTRIEVNPELATGLLAQAKLGIGNSEGKYAWGRLTKSQITLFPVHSDYYSLLLYRLSGGQREKLSAFGWQLCAGWTPDQLKKSLRSGTFPEEMESSKFLKKLFSNEIGTPDVDIIKNVIDPNGPGAQAIDLQVFWPDDKTPPDQIRIKQSTHRVQRMVQYR